MPDPELLSPEEVFGGLPAGRARTALFLIESQTARRMARVQQAMNVDFTEEGDRPCFGCQVSGELLVGATDPPGGRTAERG